MRRLIARGVLVSIVIGLVGCSTGIEPSIGAPEESAQPSISPVPATDAPAAAPSTATPSTATTATPPVVESIEPVAGTELPLAGRDGVPGPVRCGGVGPTTLEALVTGPVGAERLEGPQYDVLRATIARYGDDPEFATLKKATFREFRLDDTRVEFLGDIGNPEGVFASVTATSDGPRWSWAGMDGACVVRGEPGAGWGGVDWSLDPAFPRPTATTRTVHLLATEMECTQLGPLEGRLAPAYVFLESDQVRVQLFAWTLEVGASCEGIEPAAITLRLPEPLADRVIKDEHPEPCRGCGG